MKHKQPIISRRQKRQMLFASDHPSNNRKATKGRIVQVVDGKQIRHNP